VTVPITAIQIVAWTEIKPLNGVATVLPIHQIIGLEDWHAWKSEHGRIHHVVGGIYQDDIGIREISGYHRICVRSIAVIGMYFLCKSVY
jgi:hypothetical protein